MEFAAIMYRGMEDLKEGVKNYELKGKMPNNAFMVSHYRSPGIVMKAIYQKAQEFMLKCNIAEGTQRPLAIHPFSGVAKKNRKIPSTTEEVEKMTGDQLWHTVGIIQNCSMLTPLSKHNTQGYLPAAMDNLCKLRENTQKSFF